MTNILKLNPVGSLQAVIFSESSATSDQMSLVQMADLVLGLGLRGDPAVEAIAISYAVSGFDPSLVVSAQRRGTYRVGLWTVEVPSPSSPQFQLMQNPYKSAEFMFRKSVGGTSWEYWEEAQAPGSTQNIRFRSMIPKAKVMIESKGGY